MTKEELITKQCLQIEDMRSIILDCETKINEVRNMFVSVGSPLNDNILKMNREQLIWCQEVLNKLLEINL